MIFHFLQKKWKIQRSINNETFGNTGGVLVFDLPDLVQKKGGQVRVFNNKIYDNNHSNFAPKGNIVRKVPKGTVVLILATNNVEIFENLQNSSCGWPRFRRVEV